MIRKFFKNIYFVIFRLLTDIILIPLIFIFAYSLKFKVGWIFRNIFEISYGKIYDHAQVEPYLKVLGIVILLWIIAFYYAGMYKSFRGFMPHIDEFFAVLKGVSLGTVELMALSFVYKDFPGSRYVILYSWLFGIFGLWFSRLIIAKIEHFLFKNGYFLQKVLVIGGNSEGQDIVERILLLSSYGYQYVGTLDNNKITKLHFHLRNKFKLLGKIENFIDIAKKYKIEVVYITLKDIDEYDLKMILNYCENNKIECKLISNAVDFLGSCVSVEVFDGIPFEVHKVIEVPKFGMFIKRIFDMVFALILLIFLMPLFILISLIIKISSPNGSVFYVQKRVGYNYKSFGMIKFRTMVVDAERKSGPVMVDEENEKRYIFVGKFLRKMSLDELPQLFNVLLGQMSIVGPRPERPFFVKKFEKEIKYYTLRHMVLPGITGWAQINGRSFLTRRPEHKIKYDLYYIKNWSILFDLKIILKTMSVVFKGEEAY